MSIRHIAAVAALPGVNSTRKAILYSLAIECDGNGRFVLNRTWLCKAAGISERTLRSNWTWLREHYLKPASVPSGVAPGVVFMLCLP